MRNFTQRHCSPARQNSQVPSERPGWMRTRSPGVRPVTPAPSSSTTPDPSAPGTCGSGTPGIPSRTKMSRWFAAAARIPTTTSPAPGRGSGQSPYSSTSLPPWRRKKTAFIGSVQVSQRFQLLQVLAVALAGSRRRRRHPIAPGGNGRGFERPRPEQVRDGTPGQVPGGRNPGARQDRRSDVLDPDRNPAGAAAAVPSKTTIPSGGTRLRVALRGENDERRLSPPRALDPRLQKGGHAGRARPPEQTPVPGECRRRGGTPPKVPGRPTVSRTRGWRPASTSRPSRDRASTSRFSTTAAPGQGPEAHQPTASAGRPADAATSQNARLRRSHAETGARRTSPAARPAPRRYQDVPSGGRQRRQPGGTDPLERANAVARRGDAGGEVRPDFGGRRGTRRPVARHPPGEEARERGVLRAAGIQGRPVHSHDDHGSRPGRRQRRFRADRFAPRGEEKDGRGERAGHGEEENCPPGRLGQSAGAREGAREERRPRDRSEQQRGQRDRDPPEERGSRPLGAEPPRAQRPRARGRSRPRSGPRRPRPRPAGATGWPGRRGEPPGSPRAGAPRGRGARRAGSRPRANSRSGTGTRRQRRSLPRPRRGLRRG